MNKKQIPFEALLLAIFLLVGNLYGGEPIFRSDFSKTTEPWRGWSEVGEWNGVSLENIWDFESNRMVLQSTIPETAQWCTPALTLPEPVVVDDHLLLRFMIKTAVYGEWEVNLTNATEGAEYSFRFLAAPNEWTLVQHYIGNAAYKRGGRVGMPPDGMTGDKLSALQIAVHGPKVQIADLELISLAGEPELPVNSLADEIAEAIAATPLTNYPELQRNGIFPFGYVVRTDANETNSAFMGMTLDESLAYDLLDMRRHYLNTYLNFCEPRPPQDRIRLAEAAGMRLIETMYSATAFQKEPDDSPLWKDFELLRQSPALLAWYGSDEPPLNRLPAYLANKKALQGKDADHPFVTAMHVAQVRHTAGPALEVMIANEYPMFTGVEFPATTQILEHYTTIRASIADTAGKYVWFMGQAFGSRIRRNPAHLSWRMPTVPEMRFTMYTALAAGANGIFFFIYNDHIPYIYLKNSDDREKFDELPIDPWGNESEIYREIATFGQQVVPIMPSFLDAEIVTESMLTKLPKELLPGERRNELASLIILVNQDLTADFAGSPQVDLPAGQQLYDLNTLSMLNSTELTLRPGEGVLWAVATPGNFAILADEISTRRAKQEESLRQLELERCQRAGFADGIPSAAWLNATESLRQAGEKCGQIHQFLLLPENRERVEDAAIFGSLHEQFSALSKRYTQLRRELDQGRVPDQKSFDTLITELQLLLEAYAQQLK